MSIKEALERVVPMEAENSEVERQENLWRLGEEGRSFGHYYREIALEAGLSIHREAGTPKLLEELAEHIRGDFSDVKIKKVSIMSNGAVSLGIEWNFRDALAEKPYGQGHNSVEIIAHPLTEDLVVEGREAFKILYEPQWRSDPKLLEDAIVRAFQNSGKGV